MEIKILHLFHDLMNLYGEYGNINILKARLIEQGVDVIVDKKSLSDEIDFSQYDFIYCGSGTERNELLALDYLKKRKDNFAKYIDSEKLMLFSGNSMELFGKKLNQNDKNTELLGLLDFEVNRGENRITGDTILQGDTFNNKIVGFINKQSVIENIKEPLFKVLFGIGDDEQNQVEGVRIKNAFGTYVIGPILVRNPELLDFFVRSILKQKNSEFEYKTINHQNEVDGYNTVLNELMQRAKM